MELSDCLLAGFVVLVFICLLYGKKESFDPIYPSSMSVAKYLTKGKYVAPSNVPLFSGPQSYDFTYLSYANPTYLDMYGYKLPPTPWDVEVNKHLDEYEKI